MSILLIISASAVRVNILWKLYLLFTSSCELFEREPSSLFADLGSFTNAKKSCNEAAVSWEFVSVIPAVYFASKEGEVGCGNVF